MPRTESLVVLDPPQQQTALLGLAILSLDRPGLLAVCLEVATQFDDGRRRFLDFRQLNTDRWTERWGRELPAPPGLAMRRVVDTIAPSHP
jgi:hypothetical protein